MSLFASRVSPTIADASHRDSDESGFPTNSQNQTLLEAELTHPELTCQCLLENGVGSERSIPIDPRIFVVAYENRRLEVSHFNACQCEIVLIPRSPMKSSFEFRQST